MIKDNYVFIRVVTMWKLALGYRESMYTHNHHYITLITIRPAGLCSIVKDEYIRHTHTQKKKKN